MGDAIKGRLSLRIKEMRKKLGLSQEELAERIGESQTEISECESGERSLGIEKLEEIAKGLNSELEIYFSPEDFSELEEDDRVPTTIMLPVGLAEEANQEAFNQLQSFNEYVCESIERRIAQDQTKHDFEENFQLDSAEADDEYSDPTSFRTAA